MKNDENMEQAYQEGEKDTYKAIVESEDQIFDLKMKIKKYEEILTEIASANEQANPVHLKGIAQNVLTFYANQEAEPTTADEFNKIKEVGKKIDDEIAESIWRGTVLHPDYGEEE